MSFNYSNLVPIWHKKSQIRVIWDLFGLHMGVIGFQCMASILTMNSIMDLMMTTTTVRRSSITISQLRRLIIILTAFTVIDSHSTIAVNYWIRLLTISGGIVLVHSTLSADCRVQYCPFGNSTQTTNIVHQKKFQSFLPLLYIGSHHESWCTYAYFY